MGAPGIVSKIKKMSPSPPGGTSSKMQGKVTILKASRINVRSSQSPSPSPDQSPPTQVFKVKAGARSEEVSPGSGGSAIEDESTVGKHKTDNGALVIGGNFLRDQLNKVGEGGANR